MFSYLLISEHVMNSKIKCFLGIEQNEETKGTFSCNFIANNNFFRNATVIKKIFEQRANYQEF